MAVVYQRHVIFDEAVPATTTTTINITINAGDTCLVMVDEALNTVVSVKDSANDTFTKLADKVGAIRETEIWGFLSCTASTNVQITWPSTTVIYCIEVFCFTGVTAFGNTGTGAGSSTTPSVSLTLQDTNGYMAAMFGNNVSTPGALSSPTGTFVSQAYANNQGSMWGTSMYNTSASTGSLTCSYTSANSTDWQVAAIELRNQAGGASKVPQITNLFRQRRA